jgi:hypothetical protein
MVRSVNVDESVTKYADDRVQARSPVEVGASPTLSNASKGPITIHMNKNMKHARRLVCWWAGAPSPRTMYCNW